MKKLALFAGLSLLAFTGCNDDDDTPEQVFPLVGTWSPTKEVITEIETDGTGVSDEIAYTDCQKESRWVFNENLSGKRTNKDLAGSTPSCSTISERNFSYVYNASEKNIEIKYQGTVVADKGKITLLDAQTMNLKIEDTTDPTVYKSTTYTFKRIAQ